MIRFDLKKIAIAVISLCETVRPVTAETLPIKVGVVIVQSGPLALIGKSILNAIVLADEQLDHTDAVQFVFEDDGAQAANALSAARKLIDVDRVSALVTFSGGPSAAVAPLAESKQIPLVTIAAGDKHTMDRKFVHRLYLSTDRQGDILLEAMERRGHHTVAVATSTQESLVRLRDLLTQRAAGRVVLNEEVAPGATDMQTLASKVTALEPDAVVLYLLPPSLSAFARSLREQEYEGAFYGAMTVFNYAEVKASHDALVGTVFPAPAPTDRMRRFEAEYRDRFGEPLASGQESYGYDTAAMFIAAASSGDVFEYLSSQQTWEGLAGTYPRRAHNFFEVPAVARKLGKTMPEDVAAAR